MNQIRLTILLLSLFLSANVSFGLSPINKTRFGGTAIKGYDVVSYFEEGKPTKGKKKFAYAYKAEKWRFSDEANLKAFERSPETYIPQYGGYYAWAVSKAYTANIDPTAWKIVDKKLYLNYSKKIKTKWEKNQAENIKKADKNWPGLLAK